MAHKAAPRCSQGWPDKKKTDHEILFHCFCAKRKRSVTGIRFTELMRNWNVHHNHRTTREDKKMSKKIKALLGNIWRC